MSEAQAAEAEAGALDTAAEGAASEAQSEPVETEARRLGWRPQEEFKGPADKWIDAEQFVQKGREILPIVQANNKALEKTVRDQAAKIAEMSQTLTEAKEFFGKAEKRAYEAAVRDIESRLDAAVDAGDTAAARAITKEATDLAEEMKAAPKAADPNAGIASARDAWIAENPWFENDPDLRAFAIGVGEDIKNSIEPLKQFAEIARRVKAAFPSKFENPRRTAAATVEGAPAGRRTASKGWADLPPEAKAMADRFIKSGFVKDRDAYVKSYQWG